MLQCMAACPSCGTANPDGFRFCGACAMPLASVPVPAREERKTITVLFADLAGFTARSEALDPEDVHAFLLPYYDVLTNEVTRHGGFVDRFLGDGIMALFGARTAHEDDPERAIRAALRILERISVLGLDLHARIGINTGPVLIVAADGDRDYLVTGDAVNTASRLQALAPIDGVVVGESTYRATAHLFRCETLTPTLVKGKAEPLAAWQPIAPLARVERVQAETTPFVGRDTELSQLVGIFDGVRSTLSPSFVTVLAEPGIGKSRLVRELGRHLDALPDLVRWRVGRCRPYGDGIGFWPLGEIVRGHAGIQEGDDQAVIRAKLEAVLVEPDPSLRAWVRDRVGPLVGLTVETAPPGQEETFTAWRRFLEEIARSGPTVLVVEDLHWADEALVAFLEHLAARAARLPLLLVTTARPEVAERHPGWLAATTSSRTVLRLGALDDAAIAQLLGAALPGADPDLIATVLERAGGSPLYAEQLAAMLREQPLARTLDGSAIPLSIQTLLAARLDSLPADAKAVLLDASVMGRSFWPGAIAALSGRDRGDVEVLLVDLARRELVRPVSGAPKGGEVEHAFIHALVREVAYGELPRATRLIRHRAVAAWITGRADNSPGPDAEVVVGHLERALDLARATRATAEIPDIERDLVTALLAAADHAMRTQPSRAVSDFRRALGLAGPDDPRRPETLSGLGRALLATFDDAAAVSVLEEASELLRARGDAMEAAELTVPLGIAVFNAGDAERADAIFAAARLVLQQSPGSGLVYVLAVQAMTAMARRRYDVALASAEDALTLAEKLGIPPPQSALGARGLARLRTDAAAGRADIRHAIERAEAVGDLHAVAVFYLDLLYELAEITGPPAEALVIADQAVAACTARGLPSEVIRLARIGPLYDTGAWDEAVAEAEAVREWAAATGDAVTQTNVEKVLRVRLERGERTRPMNWLSEADRRLGVPPTDKAAIVAEATRIEVGRDAARSVLADAIGRTPPGELYDPAGMVRACLRADAVDLARRALELGASSGPMLAIGALAAEAMIAEAEGHLDAARLGFAQAAEAYARLGVVPERAYALVGLGRCQIALGETAEGVVRLRESRVIWECLRAVPRIAEIDAILATAGT